MENYLKIVAILNFLVDFLLILGVNGQSGHPLSVKRAAAAALLGAAHAAGCLLPGFRFLSGIFWRLIFLGLMALVAFGWDRGALRRSGKFVFLSVALGGIALGLDKGGLWAAMMAGLFGYLMYLLGFGNRPGKQQYVPVVITHNGRTIQLTALVDTGNTLRDPVTGKPVLVADARAAENLLHLTQVQLQHPVETLSAAANSGLRLIPYTAVGGCGLLLGLRVQQLEINGKREDMIVAFTPQTIGRGRPFQALAGGTV